MFFMTDKYEQRMSGAWGTPGSLIVLLDQSALMTARLGDGLTKAACAAGNANTVLEQVVDQCTKGEHLRDDMQVGVIGFGNGLTDDLLNQGSMPGGLLTVNEVDSQARLEEFEKYEDDGTDKPKVLRQKNWFSPRASGSALLAPALDAAAAKVGKWVATYPKSFPPIILIITGGLIADKTAAEMSAAALKRIGTSNGTVLVFVCHVCGPDICCVEFPCEERSLSDERVKWLAFSLASEIPEPLARYGAGMGLRIQHRSRGYVTSKGPGGVLKLARLLSAPANNSEWLNRFFMSNPWPLGDGDSNKQERKEFLDGPSTETATSNNQETAAGTYLQEISAGKDLFGCLIMLLDQSGAMAEQFGTDKRSKAVVVARAVNMALESLVDQCTKGESVRDCFHVGVIGYGTNVAQDLLGVGSGPGGLMLASELEARACIEEIEVDEDDGTGKLKVVRCSKWIDPGCSGGPQMGDALKMAADKLREWVSHYPSSFPPMVLNITDGEPNVPEAAESAARALQKISTSDGGTLLFNCHISASGAAPMEYPTSDIGLPDSLSKWLFGISSEIPDTMVSQVQKAGLSTVTTGSRGFVYNATAGKLVKFLRCFGNFSR